MQHGDSVVGEHAASLPRRAAAVALNPVATAADESGVPRILDRLALPVALLAGAVLLTWSSTATGDATVELRPSVDLLLAGHVGAFLAAAPVYGPSILPRVPFLLAAHALGGGWVQVFLAGALACMLAPLALALALDGRTRQIARPAATRATVAVVCLLAPWLLRATPMGHPEETLAGALCAIAVLIALRGRSGWAGLVLGAAIACKPWALLAVGPVLLAAPERRVRLLLVCGAGAAAALAPFYIGLGTAHVRGAVDGLRVAPSYFHPEQLWWPLRERVFAPGSHVAGYRGPALIEHLAHPGIVALAVPLSALFAWRLRAGAVERRDALALLALLLMLRCLLDPWNTIYYLVPAVLALVAWEALAREGLPTGALALTALGHVTFVTLQPRVGPDALAACYLAWALPATGLLARAAFTGAPAPAARPAQSVSSAIAASSSPGAT